MDKHHRRNDNWNLNDSTESAHESLLTPKRAARLAGVSVEQLAEWRDEGAGPPFKEEDRDGNTQVTYDRAELEEWLNSNPPELEPLPDDIPPRPPDNGPDLRPLDSGDADEWEQKIVKWAKISATKLLQQDWYKSFSEKDDLIQAGVWAGLKAKESWERRHGNAEVDPNTGIPKRRDIFHAIRKAQIRLKQKDAHFGIRGIPGGEQPEPEYLRQDQQWLQDARHPPVKSPKGHPPTPDNRPGPDPKSSINPVYLKVRHEAWEKERATSWEDIRLRGGDDTTATIFRRTDVGFAFCVSGTDGGAGGHTKFRWSRGPDDIRQTQIPPDVESALREAVFIAAGLPGQLEPKTLMVWMIRRYINADYCDVRWAPHMQRIVEGNKAIHGTDNQNHFVWEQSQYISLDYLAKKPVPKDRPAECFFVNPDADSYWLWPGWWTRYPASMAARVNGKRRTAFPDTQRPERLLLKEIKTFERKGNFAHEVFGEYGLRIYTPASNCRFETDGMVDLSSEAGTEVAQVRGHALCFSGGRPWRWDGKRWTQTAEAPAPPPALSDEAGDWISRLSERWFKETDEPPGTWAAIDIAGTAWKLWLCPETRIRELKKRRLALLKRKTFVTRPHTPPSRQESTTRVRESLSVVFADEAFGSDEDVTALWDYGANRDDEANEQGPRVHYSKLTYREYRVVGTSPDELYIYLLTGWGFLPDYSVAPKRLLENRQVILSVSPDFSYKPDSAIGRILDASRREAQDQWQDQHGCEDHATRSRNLQFLLDVEWELFGSHEYGITSFYEKVATIKSQAVVLGELYRKEINGFRNGWRHSGKRTIPPSMNYERARLREVGRKTKALGDAAPLKALLVQQEREVGFRLQVIGAVIQHLERELQQIGIDAEPDGAKLQGEIDAYREASSAMMRNPPRHVSQSFDEDILLSELPEPLKEFIRSLGPRDRTIMLRRQPMPGQRKNTASFQDTRDEVADQTVMTPDKVRAAEERLYTEFRQWLAAKHVNVRLWQPDCLAGHDGAGRAVMDYVKRWWSLAGPYPRPRVCFAGKVCPYPPGSPLPPLPCWPAAERAAYELQSETLSQSGVWQTIASIQGRTADHRRLVDEWLTKEEVERLRLDAPPVFPPSAR